MKIPNKKTCGYAICKMLYQQDCMNSGAIITSLKDRFVRATILDKLVEMEDLGQIVREREMVTLTLPMRRHFDQCEADTRPAPAPTTSVATGPVAREFKPLTGYKLRREGMREGSNDYRNWPSRHLP